MKYTFCPHCLIPLTKHTDNIVKGYYYSCQNDSLELGCPISFRQAHTYFTFRLNQYLIIVKGRKNLTLIIYESNAHKEFGDPIIFQSAYVPLDFSNIEILKKKIQVWLTFS
jgi:hypothetical protein